MEVRAGARRAGNASGSFRYEGAGESFRGADAARGAGSVLADGAGGSASGVELKSIAAGEVVPYNGTDNGLFQGHYD